MKKKLGFTLAEVLITLGIIGVVAALTAPALVQNTGSAQIGPKLAKAVSTFEIANQNLLNEAAMDTLTAANAFNGDSNISAENYVNNLANYMKISYLDETNDNTKYKDLLKNFHGENYLSGLSGGLDMVSAALLGFVGVQQLALSKDNVLYGIGIAATPASVNTNEPVYKRQIGMLLIDINAKAEPNRLGRDAFFFKLCADGSLQPVGGNGWSVTDGDKYNWKTGTKDKCNETTVTSGWSCAGSVFENNLKVIYQ